MLSVIWIYNQHGAEVFNIIRMVQGYGNIKMIDPNFEHNKKQMALETQLACATNMFSRKAGNKGQCFILSHASIQFGLNNLLICIQDLMWKAWQTTHAGEQRNQMEKWNAHGKLSRIHKSMQYSRMKVLWDIFLYVAAVGGAHVRFQYKAVSHQLNRRTRRT